MPQLPAETAEVVVIVIAQSQQPVVQVRQRQRRAHAASDEAHGAIGRIAFTGGADHKQHATRLCQRIGIEYAQIDQARIHAGQLQTLHGLPRQLLGRAGLAGVGDPQGITFGGRTRGHRRHR